MSNPATKGCHNCRRRRLRCDRSVPTCLKCSTNGEECLGYGTLLRWTNAPAIKGKLAGQFRTPVQKHSQPVTGNGKQRDCKEEPDEQLLDESPSPDSDSETRYTILPGLLDPIFDQLNRNERCYIDHFSTAVCRDLVSHDQVGHNPFRGMIPLIQEHGYLQSIIVATSAMHLATANQHHGRPARRQLVDALAAKHKAIRLLREAIEASPANQTAILAAIIFFVNLDLIDSGKGMWENHVKAAENLISSLQRRKLNRQELDLVPLADAITADCLTYRILGPTIGGDGVLPDFGDKIDVPAVLKRAQTHSYHCSPPDIMNMILLANQHCAHGSATGDDEATRRKLASLLEQARAFDVHTWVYGIEGLAPDDDLEARVSIASAHRAAACLYILLVMPVAEDDSLEGRGPDYHDLEDLEDDIFNHLSRVPMDHSLLKGTVWPTFMAGAQTDDPAKRKSCQERLGAVYTQHPEHICPWGYVRTAIEMLDKIWKSKETEPSGLSRTNWLQRLRNDKEGRALIV
ncbi:fungal-specific transcription factor domain-containing protein [Podospora aff. communis PSN243]|uniref:Fungal-specific transcription factor domain-containing protein n=1 Tax=Podospora aff. communis PSN243 TaxID=3040156 RepID=A0AAV9G598_9PEZI|nr:fungal-specific transcription factor domain-containing protein [Podospora aff. communis PSN243]